MIKYEFVKMMMDVTTMMKVVTIMFNVTMNLINVIMDLFKLNIKIKIVDFIIIMSIYFLLDKLFYLIVNYIPIPMNFHLKDFKLDLHSRVFSNIYDYQELNQIIYYDLDKYFIDHLLFIY